MWIIIHSKYRIQMLLLFCQFIMLMFCFTRQQISVYPRITCYNKLLRLCKFLVASSACVCACVCTPSLLTPHPQPKARRQSTILIHISDFRGQSECVFPLMKKGTFMWVETGGMWNQEDRKVKIRHGLTISERVCWGHCILGRRERERRVGRRAPRQLGRREIL